MVIIYIGKIWQIAFFVVLKINQCRWVNGNAVLHMRFSPCFIKLGNNGINNKSDILVYRLNNIANDSNLRKLKLLR